MIEMVVKECIRKKHFVEGWSIREISRNFKISRQSVRKMLQDADVPKYRLTEPRPSRVMKQWKPIIEAWLREDEKPGVPKKQRHTANRIYERLKEEYGDEFIAAESTVRYWVRRIKNKIPQAFIPLSADAGELAEADFGHVQVKINGKPTDVHLFAMRLRFSGVPFVCAFSSEKIEAFLEGHRLAFEWFNGVPADLRYDNPKTAVTKILTGPRREEHELLSSLRAHYLFDSDFCRPGEPHEKGGVEHLVGYVRRHTCVPVPDIPNLEALNSILLAWCKKERTKRWELWEQERAALRALPVHAHRCVTTRPVLVNKLCLISFDYNRYSIPSMYVGKTLVLRAYAEKIEILERERVIATHPRCHERKKTFLELEHYLPVLAYKPHAATHAAVVRQLPEIYQRIRRRMTDSHPEGYKDFVAILLLHQVFAAKDILAAIEEIGADTVTAEQIRSRIMRPSKPQNAVVVPDELQHYQVTKQNLSRYDLLAKGVVH